MIQLEANDSRGVFYYEQDHVRLALSTFVKAGNDKIIMDHTEVDDSLKGSKIGLAIVQKVVEYARENGVKIVPLCPFVKAMFEKYPEFQDVQY